MLVGQATVRVSTRSFVLWWLSLLLLHGIAGAFFGFCALFYWELEGTYLDECLQFYGIGMKTATYSTIAALQGLVALPHALVILKMVSASLYYRTFAFTFASPQKTRKRRKDTRSKLTSQQQSSTSSNDVRSTARYLSLLPAFQWPAWMSKCYCFFMDRNGVFGVEGQYFHAILFCRELVETSLQTNQAYRMSYYLPRVWLNRFYVVLLVLNCWLTPLIHFMYKNSEAKKRLLSLVCDCALDLAASVIIPCTILATYYGAYEPELEGFDIMAWYDDVWFVHVVSEFQMLLVVSWRDLGTRLVFSLGLIVAMSDVKDLLAGVYSNNQVEPLPSGKTGAVAASSRFKPTGTAGPSIDALLAATASTNTAPVQEARPPLSVIQQPDRIASIAIVASKYSHRMSNLVHAVLFVWGAVILGLHVYAESSPNLSQCLLQVRPWGKVKPACSLVLLNCYSSDITGSESEVAEQWSILDQEMVVRILIRHCEALEMPPVLQELSHLSSLKLYNTTIADWSEDAALTTASHPHLTSLFLVRVNMTDGELPQGLLSSEFPASVNDIEFCVTNLRSLPPDLDAKWPRYVSLYFESSAFTSVPEVMLRMEPFYLSLFGNPIHEVPRELFEVSSIEYLHFGDTLVTALPSNVTFDSSSSALSYVYLSNTEISFFPAWLDGIVAAARTKSYRPIYASGTPYCSQLAQVYAGTLSEFAIAQSDELTPPSVLMDASPGNIELLYQIMSCKPAFAVAFFPLDFEDEKSGLVVG